MFKYTKNRNYQLPPPASSYRSLPIIKSPHRLNQK